MARAGSTPLIRAARWLSGVDRDPTWEILVAMQIQGGRFVRFDAFDLDQEADARRLLAELRPDDRD